MKLKESFPLVECLNCEDVSSLGAAAIQKLLQALSKAAEIIWLHILNKERVYNSVEL